MAEKGQSKGKIRFRKNRNVSKLKYVFFSFVSYFKHYFEFTVYLREAVGYYYNSKNRACLGTKTRNTRNHKEEYQEMKHSTMKRIAALLVAVLTVLTLAACGKTTPDPANNEPVSTDNSGVTLTWFVPKMDQDDDAAVFAAANEIIGAKLNGLKVNFIPIDSGSYADKMNAKVGAGEEFDICFTSSWLNPYNTLVSNEALLPLDDLLPVYAPELWDLIPEAIWDGTRIQGKIYGVPNYQVSTSGKSFWFQKDLVDKYGFDLSSVKGGKDWRSLEEFFKLVKANDPSLYPTTSNQIWGLVAQCEGFSDGYVGGTGYRRDDPNTEYINEYATDEFKAYLQTCKDWYDNGYVRSDIATASDTTKDTKAGKYASGWGTTKPGMETEMLNNYGFEVVTVKMTDDSLSTGGCTATMNAVSSTSKHPEAAVQLLNLMNSDVELYNLIVHGIEGTHWEKNPELGENYITVLEGATDKYHATDWMMGCVFNGYLQEGQDPDVWEQTKVMNENAVPDALLGFSFDMTTVQTEVSNVDAAKEKYLTTLEFGVSKDMEGDLANMLADLEKAGMQDVLNEMNAQVEEWKAENGK